MALPPLLLPARPLAARPWAKRLAAARPRLCGRSERSGLVRLAVGLAFLVGVGTGAGCTHGRAPQAALDTLAAYREALRRDDAGAAYALLATPLTRSISRDEFFTRWKETKAERAAQLAQLDGLRGREPAPGGAGLELGAALPLPDGSELNLLEVAESGRREWRLLQPEPSPPAADTPLAALQQLLRAVEQRDYHAILLLLGQKERQALESELNERADRLRAALATLAAQARIAESEAAQTRDRNKDGQNKDGRDNKDKRPLLTQSLPPDAPAELPGSSSTPGLAIEVTGDRARLRYDPRFFVELRREQPAIAPLPQSAPRANAEGAAGVGARTGSSGQRGHPGPPDHPGKDPTGRPMGRSRSLSGASWRIVDAN